ncbi:MAG: DUF1934 domain-containing protein [Lachnospiraceae bacterium]|nr:DUF1934 domain-containing protein [Lachnospiraceae bacterium]
MTKDVLVKVSGMQFDMGDEPIELVINGTYYLKNGKHYVLYEEQPEDDDVIIRNIVKFNDHNFEMIKRGGNNSYLRFEKESQTSTVYQTPVGPIQIDIFARDFEFSETDREISARIKYTLDINYEFVSECEVTFRVLSR